LHPRATRSPRDRRSGPRTRGAALERAGSHGFHRSLASGGIRQRIRGIQLVDELAEPRVRTIPHVEARAACLALLVHQRNDLILLQLIERNPGIRGALTIFLLAGERQSAHLVSLVVEEEHPRHGPGPIDHLAVDDAWMHPVLVRDDHSQCAVGVDDVDPFDVDLGKLLRRARLAESGERDDGACTATQAGAEAQQSKLLSETTFHDSLSL
jgi:hypothetical protein